MYDREVGYCQGSPFIVGMLLMQVRHCSPCVAQAVTIVEGLIVGKMLTNIHSYIQKIHSYLEKHL